MVLGDGRIARYSLPVALFSVLLIGAMVCSLVPCVAADAETPRWDESKEWAYGGKAYLDVQEGTDQYQLITSLMPYLPNFISRLSNANLNDINVNGSVESYLYVSITNVTADHYIVKVIVGAGASVSGDLKVSATIATYTNNVSAGDVTKFVVAAADMDLTTYSATELRVDRTTLAIESANTTSYTNLHMAISATNIPLDDANGTTYFKSFRVTANLDSNATMNLTFSPALDLFEFPIASGDKWFVSSTVTATGNVSGGLKINGLDKDVIQLLPFLDVNGTMDLSNITGAIDGLGMQSGSFGPYSQAISMKMHCVGMTNATVDGKTYDAYTIYVNDYSAGEPEFIFYYVPSLTFMSSVDVTSNLMDEMDLSGNTNLSLIRSILQSNFGGDLSMSYMEPAVAAQEIEKLTGEDVQVKSPIISTGSQGLDMTLITIVLLALVAVVIIAAVIVTKRRK